MLVSRAHLQAPTLLLCFFTLLAGVNGVEYCSGKLFEASCSKDEVIFMQQALFGRMGLGRCVQADLGFIGCFHDVLPVMDHKCSGKRQCSVPVVDTAFSETDPCSKDLRSYLEASYTCQRVLPSSTICKMQEIELRDKVSILSSRHLVNSDCFRPDFQTNIYIKASPGQQINLTLHDLQFDPANQAFTCVNYGHIEDLHTKQGTTLCGGRRRINHVIVSNSYYMKLTLNSNLREQNFALKMELSGCPQIQTQPGSWTQKEGNTTTVGCHNSRQSWTLVCDGNRWIGSLGNCSQAPKLARVEMGRVLKPSSISSEISITLISCITILLCLSVIAAAANYWKRNTIRSLVIRLQHDTLQHAAMSALPQAMMTTSMTSANGDESEYMALNLKTSAPKSTIEESEDALYDFCFLPGGDKDKQTNKQNALIAKTLPNKAEKSNNSTVRFKTHSPFRKKQLEAMSRFECVIEE